MQELFAFSAGPAEQISNLEEEGGLCRPSDPHRGR